MSGALSIQPLSAESRARWDSFVLAHPEASFFHLSNWQGLIADVFGHRTFYFYAERGGQIIAVLPLAEIRSRIFGHSLSSLPFCVYGGIVGEPDGVAALETRAEEVARELGVHYLEYRNVHARHADWPKQDLYARFRKAISSNDDENLEAIPRKQRAMVRKGIKNDLRGVIDPDASRFFRLYSDNVLRHGTPALPKRLFEELLKRFRGNCDVLTVTGSDGRPLSSVLSFYFRDEVLPYYAGDDVMARQVAANDFKYWELMRRAVARGCRVFDYGRSKAGTGPWSFKKNWGFEPEPLSYEYRLYKRDAVPQNNPLNPKYRLLTAAWRRLPLPIANTLGPYIVRNLG
jgi:FemAB-related protein (PEP-CTERM system-associated)